MTSPFYLFRVPSSEAVDTIVVTIEDYYNDFLHMESRWVSWTTVEPWFTIVDLAIFPFLPGINESNGAF